MRAKKRAAAFEIEFTISRDQVKAWLEIGRCAATGIAFALTPMDDGRAHPFAPSLDRIEPKLGYVPGNCRLVVWIFNRAKGDGTDADVWALVDGMRALQRQQEAA